MAISENSPIPQLRAAKDRVARGFIRSVPGHLASVALGAPTRIERIVAANVHSVGIGYKTVAGKVLDTLCVRVAVVRKLPADLVPERFLIPRTVDGIPVDVVQRRPAELHWRPKRTVATPVDPAATVRQRPLAGGISICRKNVDAGTIAAFCRRRGDASGKTYLLSCRHVLAPAGGVNVGDGVYQPGGLKEIPADRVAEVVAFSDYAQTYDGSTVDAALAEIAAGVGYADPDPATLQTPADLAQIFAQAGPDGVTLAKTGRATGQTEGVLTEIEATQWVWTGSGLRTYANQLLVEAGNRDGPISAFGDSGAPVLVAKTGEIAGLLCGGGRGEYFFATPIAAVMDALGIDLL